eukprot:TRINITY_DN8194_c0_g6_i1.p2 TRINITY_DN8194_c0_g6~~TRINITY_DN8194_c0_g6_i1.p2  ORF type:complete len:124 (+),score=13.85 TRINITY_DN8194_c0_g6_i1:37-372(+)
MVENLVLGRGVSLDSPCESFGLTNSEVGEVDLELGGLAARRGIVLEVLCDETSLSEIRNSPNPQRQCFRRLVMTDAEHKFHEWAQETIKMRRERRKQRPKRARTSSSCVVM